MSTYSVLHYAIEHDLEPWRVLFNLPAGEDYGIGPAVIADPEGNMHHDEYHPMDSLEHAANRAREDAR